MSAGWSWFVVALVALNIVGCVWLLIATSRRRAGDAPAEQTGHVWDEDLTEYNKPLPRWWINLFYITIVFTLGYLVWYPGAGNFAGVGKWTSDNEHAAQKAAGDARLAVAFKPYEGKPLDELAGDPKALALGRSVFANNCAQCHGAAAQGAVGYPNLTDRIWHWGGSPEQVLQTVLDGRQAAMPGWAPTLLAMGGPGGVEDVASYVQSLAATPGVDAAAAARGKVLFTTICAACHGPDAKGNVLMGAPDLTDDYWLYGKSRESILQAINGGRNGQMPAHRQLLGETRARLAAAYVWSLSHP
jgi:cytochrome c oxidase cbb3-type subunit 3